MSRPTRSFPPPEDAAARYDAVLRRGHSLRRRQRLITGAGAGGAMLALLAVVLFVTTGGSNSDDQNQVVSDPTVTTATTVTTVPPPEMSVEVMADSGSVAVRIEDPYQPVLPGAQICANVRVAADRTSGPAVAEGRACWDAAIGIGVDTTESELRLTDGVEIGCAASTTAERDPDVAPTSLPGTASTAKDEHHNFAFSIPAGLPPGDYVAEVIGVSGVGDGCAPNDDTELETVARGEETFELP